ncbi:MULTISPECIES: hypothetical protein [Maribacter]|uniref:hypothetical protein n=1 Tax=Maribacter TaxID=252356 RepID=UPI000C15B576|nr:MULTISPECIES: hypothetical protein [unclassified Maribacter]PIB39170.1 hypothetical protein BFP75_12775 [Maribacter sp. 4G9]
MTRKLLGLFILLFVLSCSNDEGNTNSEDNPIAEEPTEDSADDTPEVILIKTESVPVTGGTIEIEGKFKIVFHLTRNLAKGRPMGSLEFAKKTESGS